MEQRAVYRMVDAATNRVAEGLRTVEEYARFYRDDGRLTEALKQMRHRLQEVVGRLGPLELLAARDTEADCGTQISVPTEQRRSDVDAVLAAAFSRTQQGLRCLEEYGKTISPELGATAEQLRYEAYTLEKRVRLQRSRGGRLESARLYVLVETDPDLEGWLGRLEALAGAGVDVIQLRDKRASDRQLLEYATRAAERLCVETPGDRCQFIINDRCDIAVASGADGVHVGQDEFTVAAARRVMGEEKLVGVSTHDVAQVRQAIDDGADYIGCGPTFPSQTKQFADFAGLAFLREAVAICQTEAAGGLPAFAIGGIDATNVADVMSTGMRRVAVSRVVWGREDEGAACRELVERLVASGKG